MANNIAVIQSHGQLRTLFIIIVTSTFTVLFMFLGLSASNLNTVEVNVPQIRHGDNVSLKYGVIDRKDNTLMNSEENLKSEVEKLRSEIEYLRNNVEEVKKDYNEVENNAETFSDITEQRSSFDDKLKIKGQNPPAECIKRLPKAIIAGVQKCGTSALLTFLSAHPQVKACMKPAETKYFSLYYKKPLSWYRNKMPCTYPNEIAMEKSPPYFYRGACATRIYAMDPNIKLIFIIKDPVVRSESMWAMRQAHTPDVLPFDEAVTINNKTEIRTGTRLIKWSNYQKFIGKWLEIFDRRQILFVDGHNLEENPDEELNIVEKFLNIDTYFTPDRFIFNGTKGKFCLRSESYETKCLIANKGRQHPSYVSHVKKLLQDYFRPFNEMFFKMINQRFNWGY